MKTTNEIVAYLRDKGIEVTVDNNPSEEKLEMIKKIISRNNKVKLGG